MLDAVSHTCLIAQTRGPGNLLSSDTADNPSSIRVLLCDGQPLTCVGLRTILAGRPGIDVVGEAASGPEALLMAEKLDVDIALVDVALPLIDGIEVARRIRAADDVGADIPVLLLVQATSERVMEGLRAGACGALTKVCDEHELCYAIEVTVRGGSFLSPYLLRSLVEELWPGRRRADHSPQAALLTHREREVLELLADGLSNEEIGRVLYVGIRTVKYHISQILRKLDVRDRVQAVAFAHRHGLAGYEGSRYPAIGFVRMSC